MSAPPVRIEWDREVPVVRLCRPHRRNAIDHATLEAARGVVIELEEAGQGVAVLAAEPPTFCAGSDFSAMGARLRDNPVIGLAELLLDSSVFWVAAVEGPAVGGGLAVLAACPLVVAGASTSFVLTERALGLFPSGVLPYLEVVMGARPAFRAAILAAPLEAREACDLGIVDIVAGDDDVLHEALTLAENIASSPAVAGDARTAWQTRFRTDQALQRRHDLLDLLPEYLPGVPTPEKESL